MVDRNTKLRELLQRIEDRNKKELNESDYYFKPFVVNKKKKTYTCTKKEIFDNDIDNSNFNNLDEFDMEAKICNLHTHKLELVVKSKPKARTMKCNMTFNLNLKSNSTMGPYDRNLLKSIVAKEETKAEYEYIYNEITATKYNVS